MVRSIGPIGKKAGSCARVHRIPPAARRRGLQEPERQPPWEQPWQVPWQPPSQPRAQQSCFSPRSALLSQPPWICWFRLSLPGLLAVRAGRGCAGNQGRMASLPGFYRGAIVSTCAGANENVADTTHLATHLAELREKSVHQIFVDIAGPQPLPGPGRCTPPVRLARRWPAPPWNWLCQASGGVPLWGMARSDSGERQPRLCSRPCRRMSLGRSMPMKTILLRRSSPSAHCGPRSLPINWCTPWKITLRSVPFI